MSNRTSPFKQNRSKVITKQSALYKCILQLYLSTDAAINVSTYDITYLLLQLSIFKLLAFKLYASFAHDFWNVAGLKRHDTFI